MMTSINFYKKIIQELINKNYSLTPFELLIKFLNYIKDRDESLGFFKSQLSEESKQLIQHMSTAQFRPVDVIPVLEQFFCETKNVKLNCMIAPLAAYFYYFEASYPRSKVKGVQQVAFIETREGNHYQATHLSRKVLLTLRRYICEIEYQYEAQAKECRNWKALSGMILHDKTKYEMAAHLLKIFSSELEVRKLGMGLYMKEPDYPWYLLDIHYDNETKIAIIKKILTMLSTPVLDEGARYMAYKALHHIDIPLEIQCEVSQALVLQFFENRSYKDITLPSPLSYNMWEFVLEKLRNNPDKQTLLKVLLLCKKERSTPKNVLNEALNVLYSQNQITDLLALVDIALFVDPEITDNHHKKLSFADKIIRLIKTNSIDKTKAGDLFIRVMYPLPLTQEQCEQFEQLLLLKESEKNRLALLSMLCNALKKNLLPSMFKETLLKHIQKFCFEEFPFSYSPLLYTTLDCLLSPDQRSNLFSCLESSNDLISLARVTRCILPPPEKMDLVYQSLIAFLSSPPTKNKYTVFEAFSNIKTPELYFLDFISLVKDKLANHWDLECVATAITHLDTLPYLNIPSMAALPLLEICQEMLVNKVCGFTTRQQACSLIQKIKQKVNTPEVDVQCFNIFINLLCSENENHGFQEQIIHLVHQIWPTDDHVQHEAVHAYFSFLKQHINRFNHNDFRVIATSLNLILTKIENPAVRAIILINLDSILLNLHDNFKSSALQQGLEQLRSTHEAKSIVDEGIVCGDLKTLVYDSEVGTMQPLSH